ncbi:MAG TPA: hypothetical protein VNU44_16030 [Bryobacteraceae bacterium]|nr:hypothetical protein [Bryobacteraceae bacterium]
MAALVVALAWGLEQVVVSPLQTGAAYPEYSSLRSDPLGAMALYESLGKVLKVDRLYKSRLRADPGPSTTIFILGVAPVAWAKLKSDTLKQYEELTAKGARLVIAFLPVSEPWKDTEARPVESRWHIRFTYKDLHVEHGEIPKESALELKPGAEWKKLGEGAFARPLGKGSVVLVSESYPLSNEGLREERNAALIVKLVGPASEVVFDENHFGVVESGSITKLMRKYNLEGALAVLALVAGLFLWRSASSLLPSRAPGSEQAVAGRDSLDGMVALLRRGIPEKDLVRVCYEEVQKIHRHPMDIVDPNDPLFNEKNPAIAYKKLMEKL